MINDKYVNEQLFLNHQYFFALITFGANIRHTQISYNEIQYCKNMQFLI